MTEVEPTIRIGQIDTRVTDPHAVIPVSCEVPTDIRIIDGAAWISFASHISDGSGPPEARIVARLRIPLTVLSAVQAELSRILDAQRKAADEAKKTAN